MNSFFFDWFSYNFMFFCGLIVFVSLRKHLLLTLLSLEYIVLTLFIFVSINCSNLIYGSYFIIFFLTFTVCEGCLGLSILVSMIRCHGNDNVKSLSLLSW
uniref:NADH-ubiquinone oxidoreductase chain 4L n=1 Tax=Tetraphleps aterrimus TaxID=452413 RepID=A0A4D6P0E3_9HEMI|nr:NADH dehydrogenase subunit 4L [Tetraphleps aterrimus]QCE31844.1 NADH dehydrogenase subunit 4L [Tetraphleps aterrimus]